MAKGRGTAWRAVGYVPTAVRSFLTASSPPRVSSAVIRKPAFDRMGGFYSANRCVFAEDTHLWVKLLLNYEVVIVYDPLVNRYCDASELALNRNEVRPIEPFLLDDHDLWRTAPSRC